MKSMVTMADMKLRSRLFSYTCPEELPVSFVYGGKVVHGIPAEFAPECEVSFPDSTLIKRVITGRNSDGLEIKVEHTEYRDYPAVEMVMYITNRGNADTERISDMKVVHGVLPAACDRLIHGNGDTLKDDGYEWFTDKIAAPVTISPDDGTSCKGAFPYMRLQGEDYGVNIAIGWPSVWMAGFAPADNGVGVCIGQKRCNMVIRPGETMRTPRVNFVAYEGDEVRGTNMWRRWYFDHILPRENGGVLPPKVCMHVFGANGKPEFTGADEGNQVSGIDDYVARGIRPDVWWVDAGWYPCDYEWTRTGTWTPDPVRFPNGLAPIGKKCAENGMQFLLWFEPERVRQGTQLAEEHPEWLLKRRVPAGGDPTDTILNLDHRDSLLNLGDRECCDWLIDHVDGVIKQSGVNIYRQDFNFDPMPYWEQNEAPDRIGAIENLHAQGYLRYWDALILRNPGLWIDSCASGGRRNDLETMRRAVPLHYTDVGYGNHPIKQKQHHQMFRWIPYFRAHNMNWDDPETGDYGNSGRPQDKFSYYAAMAPALTDMLEHDASDEDFALARQMQPIWRKAAGMMLSCDYYQLEKCRKSSEDFYAVQFHDPDGHRGFIEILANTKCTGGAYTAHMKALDGEAVYVLTEAESGAECEYTGAQLMNGTAFDVPRRTGRIWFYERKDVRG